MNFFNRTKYVELKIYCKCVGVYKIYEGNDYKKNEVLSKLKNKKLKINNILFAKRKDMLENPDFEQDYWSRTAISIYKIGHVSIRSMKRLPCYDRSYYEIVNYYDLMGGILKAVT